MEITETLQSDRATVTDYEVIDRVLQGDKEWFEVLIKRNNQRLFRIVRGYIKNDEEVKDVMQNTYLKAFENLAQFHRDAAFSTWLIRIGINESLMRLRRLKAKRNHMSYVRSDVENDSLPSEIELMNPEKKAIQHETRKFIEQAVDGLPEIYRIVYVMRELEGLSHREIAQCLHLSESNVKVRLHRAKIMLQKELYDLSADIEIYKFGGSHCHDMRSSTMDMIHAREKSDPVRRTTGSLGEETNRPDRD